MNQNDIYWKGLIEDLFPYFIPFFLPQHAYLFDVSRPVVFLDKELQQLFPEKEDRQNIRFVDKLVKVFTTTGEEKWVLIHIEVQGYTDPLFAQRMFTYFYRILDRYQMPVTAIAIFTDSSPTFSPDRFVYEFAGTSLPFAYNTYKVLHQPQEELEKSDNPFAIAVLTVLLALKRKMPDDDSLLQLKVALVRLMYAKGFSPKTTRQLFNFIKRYVKFARPETALAFDNSVNLITNDSKPMGLEEQILEMTKQEGKAEGKAEGKTEFVSNLLRQTDFSDEKIASLAGVTESFVQKTRSELH